MKLKTYLESNKISQYRFSKLMNTSTANISRWATGMHIPSLIYIKKIKEITGGQVTIVDFYEGKQ